MTLTNQEFYRLWVLAQLGFQQLWNSPKDLNNQVKLKDTKLLEKIKMIYDLGLEASWQTTQVK